MQCCNCGGVGVCGSYKTYAVHNLVQQLHPQVAGPLQNFPVSILGLHDALGLGGFPTSWLDTWPRCGLLEKSIPSFSGWIREGR